MVFAKKATFSVRDIMLLHYPSQSDVNENSSRYVSELNRWKKSVGQLKRYALVCLDEPFANTNAFTGTKQNEDVIEFLYTNVRCTVIMTTHFSGLIPPTEKKTACFHRHVRPGSYKLHPGPIVIEDTKLIEQVPYVTLEEMKNLFIEEPVEFASN